MSRNKKLNIGSEIIKAVVIALITIFSIAGGIAFLTSQNLYSIISWKHENTTVCSIPNPLLNSNVATCKD